MIHQFYGTAQKEQIPNFEVTGVPQNAIVPEYIKGDFGVSWATNPVTTLDTLNVENGYKVTVWNTNGSGAGRMYVKANDVWKKVADLS